MPPQSQQAQQQQQQQTDQQLAIAAAAVVGTATTVAAALIPLLALFTAAGLTRRALAGALTVVLSIPPDPLGALGPAQYQVFQMNVMRRAQFLVAACRRLQDDIDVARAHGRPIGPVVDKAIARERRYYALHLQAIYQRSLAAARVDSQASLFGDVLGWYATMDSHTSAECRRANGRNFLAAHPPLIGYPGAVHPRCRCYPGRPHEGAKLLPSLAPSRQRARIPA